MRKNNCKIIKIAGSILLQVVFGSAPALGQDVLRDNPGLITETKQVECAAPSIDLICFTTSRDREKIFADLEKTWSSCRLGMEEVAQQNGNKVNYYSLIGKSEENYYYIIAFWNSGDQFTQLAVAGPKNLLIKKPLSYASYQEAGLLIRSITTQLGIYAVSHDYLKATDCKNFIHDNSLSEIQKQYDSMFFQKTIKCVVKVSELGVQAILETDQGVKIYSNSGEIDQVDQLPDLGEK